MRPTSARMFQIAKQVSPVTSRPWFIAETTITLDGPRSRIVDGRWATREEAEKYLEDKQSS